MLFPDFTPFPQLETNRLLLRNITLADAPGVHRLRSDKNVMKYINRPLTHTLREAETWIGVVMDALAANEGITWCICLREAPEEHVGSIGLWRFDRQNHRAEIGYMLEPSLQGKGIMYEAIQKVLDYGFQQLKLHSIEAQIDPQNVASAALLKKAGFVQEAYFRENCYHQGFYTDTAVFSILTPVSQSGAEKAVVAKAHIG